MRTRNRTTISKSVSRAAAVVPVVHTFCSGDPPSSSSTQSIAAYNLATAYVEERISDDLGKKKSNPCVHRCHKVDIGELETMHFPNVVSGRSCNTQYAPAPYVLMAQESYRNTYHAYNVSSDTSVPGSWSFGSTAINENVMINNVLEYARQLKADVLLNVVEANQIWPSIKSLATSLPNMARNWRDLRNVLKSASGGYLAYKFGVSPILSDLMNVHRYLPRMREDVVRHQKQQARRFSVTAELPCTYTAPMPNMGFKGDVVTPPVLRFVLVVKPKTKYHTELFARIDHFVSRFATSPASLAWELVPFSFVVDWFVDLRGVLNAVDNVVGSSPYEIVSFTRSFSYHLESSFQLQNFSACDGTSVIQTWPRCTSEMKHYERSLVSNNHSISWIPQFGKSQAAISAALISQKLSQLSWGRTVPRSRRG